MKKRIWSVVLAAAIVAGTGVHALANREASKDIVETAAAAGSFETLAAALKAADLVSTLKGNGPFTVFAPTDEAFAKLPAGTIENLLKPENKARLQAILTYHVVSGKVPASKVTGMPSATTLEGSTLRFAARNGAVYVNDAKVVNADVEASNGIIHVIDTVVLPPAN